MAAKRQAKAVVEFLLSGAEISGLPEKALAKSRNLVQVDLVWPRTGVARKSAAREAVFKRGKVSFSGEEWAKRILFREEIVGRCGLAVTVTEPVTVQKLRRFARLTAKYALKMGADFVEKAMAGYADIASSPLDAIAAMVGEKDAPKAIAQGVVDFDDLPGEGEEREVEITLKRPATGKAAGKFVIVARG